MRDEYTLETHHTKYRKEYCIRRTIDKNLLPYIIVVLTFPTVLLYLLPYKWLSILPAMLGYHHFQSQVIEESILKILNVGIQLSTKRRNGACTHRFMESSHVQNIFINEGISMSKVYFYLLFQTKDNKIELAFQHFNPPLSILRHIKL